MNSENNPSINPTRKKLLFIDRDGTIILETSDEQIDAFEKLTFYPKVIYYLARIVQEFDYELVMISNQDGLGTPSFPENTFWPVQNFITDTLKNEGIIFSELIFDRTFANENSPTRKPGTALLQRYFSEEYDLTNSFVIGDRMNDMVLAKNIQSKGLWLNNHTDLGGKEGLQSAEELKETIALETQSWEDIYVFLKGGNQVAVHKRTTNETEIAIKMDLNGSGKAEINTGLHFFDHMLEQIAKHGDIDLSVSTKGDLHIDEHHTIEDTAIALGEAFAKALGNKLGIERYGFNLPMDDCLAEVAIDFGGRGWLVWEAEFNREKIGDVPTEMFYHFFKSFCDAAKCNVNIRVTGTNEHHKIESIFKAFAKSIKMAKQRNASKMVLPSTKGLL